MAAINWTSSTTFEIAGTRYISDLYGLGRESPEFCILKHPRIIDRYATLLADLAPRAIVEIGIFEGASTALFHDLAQPDKLVAIDYAPAPAKLVDWIARQGLVDTIAVYGGVDQANVELVEAIITKEIPGNIDLVVDDASHLLGPSRATFNTLFPRLRPGGLFVLEDWATGLRDGGPSSHRAGEKPLVDLLTEIIHAKGRHPQLILDVTVRSGWASIERGPDIVARPFDVATY